MGEEGRGPLDDSDEDMEEDESAVTTPIDKGSIDCSVDCSDFDVDKCEVALSWMALSAIDGWVK